MQDINEEDMKVDEEKKVVEIALPSAEFLQEPSVMMDEVRTFSDGGLFRGKINWDQGFDLAALAQEEIKQEAIDAGILQKAQENAETVLKEFIGHMGYKVIINRQ